MKTIAVFNRSLLALTLGAALASLPVSVRAQDETPAPATTATGVEAAPAPEPAASPIQNTTVKSTASSKKLPKVSADQKLSAGDKIILRRIAGSNEAEIEHSKAELTNGENEDNKAYAKMMVEEHGKANEELIALANKHQVDLKPELSQKERASLLRMKGLKGNNLDGLYIKHMIASHEDTLKDLKKSAPSIKDPELKAFAEQLMPKVEEHLKAANDLASKMGPGGAPAKVKEG